MSLLNESTRLNCSQPQLFASFDSFFKCYTHLASENPFKIVFAYVLIAATIFFNLLILIFHFIGSIQIKVFDQILVGHAIVDGLTGLIDIPFYHIYDLFGYWPLDKRLALYWSSYDNNINLITSLHMLYASYARLRSVRSTKNQYKKEFLMRWPYLIMLSFWLVGLAVWIPITVSFGLVDFTLEIDYRPYYLSALFNLVSWALPLTAIFFLSIYIYYLLLMRSINAKKHYLNKNLTKNNIQLDSLNNGPSVWPSSLVMDTNLQQMPDTTNRALADSSTRLEYLKIKLTDFAKRNCRLRAPGRFLIIMASYWIQWSLPCFLKIMSVFINEQISAIPTSFTSGVYWLTYTVCCTDALCVLLFNPNITYKRKNQLVNIN